MIFTPGEQTVNIIDNLRGRHDELSKCVRYTKIPGVQFRGGLRDAPISEYEMNGCVNVGVEIKFVVFVVFVVVMLRVKGSK